MAGSNSAARSPASLAQEPSVPPENRGVPPFATIYSEYFDFVWASTRRLGVSVESVDDVVQEVFVIIHSRLHTIQQPDSLRSWIFGVVRRTVSGYHRLRKVKSASTFEIGFFDELFESNQLTPLEHSEQSDQLKLLAKLLAELDATKREVFILAELNEMTAPEIAETLQIPLNTVYSRLRTARQAFEQALARHAAREKGGNSR
ncbi:MAG: RNA polymerase sigma factor [Myxococcota bacterium]